MKTKSDIIINQPIEYSYLENVFQDYKSVKDKVARMAKEGELVRLKKGLYIKPDNSDLNNLIDTPLIANRLYGPSYVSLQWALAYYGLIPEMVYNTTSVTIKRKKSFINDFGTFYYTTIDKDYFPIGIKNITHNTNTFLIASPEKAMCDMIVTTKGLKLQSLKAMREYMEEDMRMDVSFLEKIDFDIIDDAISLGIKKRELRLLKEYLLHEQ